MIVIKKKNNAVLIDERNTVDVEFNKKRKVAWVRIVKPDGKLESFNHNGVVAVEYRPNNEPFTLTMNNDGTEE